MSYGGMLHSVLIVSGGEKSAGFISGLLCGEISGTPSVAHSADEARRLLAEGSFELAVIDAPLPDGSDLGLAADTAASGASGVILLVEKELFDKVRRTVAGTGVLTVAKPVSKPLFTQALNLTKTTREKLRVLDSDKPEQMKLEDIRLINSAKWMLIEYLNMSEEQAHRYIEKQAMDMRISRREVAGGILKTYMN